MNFPFSQGRVRARPVLLPPGLPLHEKEGAWGRPAQRKRGWLERALRVGGHAEPVARFLRELILHPLHRPAINQAAFLDDGHTVAE